MNSYWPTRFRFDATRARSRFEEGLAEAQSRGLVPVLSNEAQCGQPISGGPELHARVCTRTVRLSAFDVRRAGRPIRTDH